MLPNNINTNQKTWTVNHLGIECCGSKTKQTLTHGYYIPLISNDGTINALLEATEDIKRRIEDKGYQVISQIHLLDEKVNLGGRHEICVVHQITTDNKPPAYVFIRAEENNTKEELFSEEEIL